MRKDRTRKRERADLLEEAATWLHELHSADTKEHEAYLEWLLESPRNVEAFLRVSTVNAALSKIDPQRSIAIEPMTNGNDAGNVVLLTDPAPKASSRRIWTIAASLALIGMIAAGSWTFTQRSAHWTHYSTAVGEQRVIALEDGSLLHINTDSRVEVRYSPHDRSVHLLAGEALFRVQQDSRRPFRVHSGGAVIQAVGTQFNVLRSSTGSTVSVIEGRVKVDRETVLDAGQEARLTNEGKVAERRAADIARVNAWRQRRLVFINETLGAMAMEFSRYNSTLKIVIDPSAAELRDYEAMSFDADDPESFVAVLEKDPHLQVEREAGKVAVRKR